MGIVCPVRISFCGFLPSRTEKCQDTKVIIVVPAPLFPWKKFTVREQSAKS